MFSNTMIRLSKTTLKTVFKASRASLFVGFMIAPLIVNMYATSAVQAASKPQSIGTFKNWVAYTYKNDSGKVCYIVSQPVSSSPKGVNRDPVFFLVTHRPADKVRNEVNTIIGYPFKKSSTTSVTIDNASGFKFFTSGDGAWAGSKEADAKVVAAMKSGANMVVVGHSQRGTKTTDKYSLSGVSAAMKAIDQACR